MRHTRCAKKEQQICSSALYRMARRSSSFFFGTSCWTRTSVRIECEAVYRSTHQSNVIFFAYDPATLQPFALRQGAHDLRHQHTSRSSMDIGYTSSNNFALYNAIDFLTMPPLQFDLLTRVFQRRGGKLPCCRGFCSDGHTT